MIYIDTDKNMIYIDTEPTAYFDVDDTLVLWIEPGQPGDIYVTDPFDGVTVLLKRHKKHIAALKALKDQKHTIVVWSAAGAVWAKAVVEALELVPFVDLVITKPHKAFDDLPAEQGICTTTYLEDT